jgi:hypothetical protein
MDEAFVRERLFRPFDSTKGSKGMGIGAYQARQFVESAGGEVRLRTAPGEGTRFEMRFPAALVERADYAEAADNPVAGDRDAASSGAPAQPPVAQGGQASG